jgi:hypothetical protein
VRVCQVLSEVAVDNIVIGVAVDRPKDRAALPYLESLRDEAGH